MQDADFEKETPMPSRRPTKEPTPRKAPAPAPAKGRKAAEDEAPDVPIIQSAELAKLVADEPARVLVDDKRLGQLYSEIEAAISAHKPDLSTGVGRKAIASLAYKVTRTKTALDEAGKELNAEARKRIEVIDARRREVRARLEDYAQAARQPLDEWEAAEELRQLQARRVLELIADAATLKHGDTSETIAARLETLKSVTIDAAVFRDGTEEAQERRSAAIAMLETSIARAKEAEERERELEARAREAEAKERELEELRKQQAAQLAELERLRAAEEERAQRERVEAETTRNDPPAAEEEEAATEAQGEPQPQPAAASAEPSGEVDHKRRVNTAARNAIEAVGVDRSTATEIVRAIIRGDIPGVTITY